MGKINTSDAPILTRNASEIATDLIRKAILEGRLEPGQRLKEEELATELGISRTPVREALLILQTEGLLSALPNRGAVVRAYTEEDLLDMYDLRALLESYAARRAAQRVTRKHLKALEESCERFTELRKDQDLQGTIQENLFFHNTIVAAAGSSKLVELVRSATEIPLVYRSFYWFSAEETEESDRAHRRLLEVLRAGDADRAQSLMREHIYRGRDFLMAHLESVKPKRKGSRSQRADAD